MSLGSCPPQLYSLASRVPSGGGSGGLGSCQSCSHEPSASQLLQSDSWDLWPGLLACRREGDSAREEEGGAGASPSPIHTRCPTSSPAQAGWLGSQSSSHRAEPTQIRPPAAGWGGKHIKPSYSTRKAKEAPQSLPTYGLHPFFFCLPSHFLLGPVSHQ